MKNHLFSEKVGNYGNEIRIIPPNLFKKILLKIRLFLWRIRNKKKFMEYAKCIKMRKETIILSEKTKQKISTAIEDDISKILLKYRIPLK